MDRAFAAVIHNLSTGLSTASVDNLFNASNGQLQEHEMKAPWNFMRYFPSRSV